MDDGLVWKADRGILSAVEQDASGLDGASARGLAGLREECSYIVADTSVEPLDVFLVGNNQVEIFNATEKIESYAAPAMERGIVGAIGCTRYDIVPSPNDYKVVLPGYHLLIIDVGTGQPKRSGRLELKGGKFIFEITDGEPLTDALQARLDARLQTFQVTIEARP